MIFTPEDGTKPMEFEVYKFERVQALRWVCITWTNLFAALLAHL